MTTSRASLHSSAKVFKPVSKATSSSLSSQTLNNSFCYHRCCCCSSACTQFFSSCAILLPCKPMHIFFVFSPMISPWKLVSSLHDHLIILSYDTRANCPIESSSAACTYTLCGLPGSHTSHSTTTPSFSLPTESGK